MLARFAIAAGVIWGVCAVMAQGAPDQPKQVVSKAHFVSTGTEIWVAPGYKGVVDVYTKDIKSGSGNWAATPSLTMTLHGPAGSADIIGTSNKTEDWGNVGPYLQAATVLIALDITVPADASFGSDWHGALTGRIVTGSNFDGMVLAEPHDVDIEGITLHVTTPLEEDRQASNTADTISLWRVAQWGLSLLALLIGVVLSLRLLLGMTLVPIPNWVWRFRR